MEFRGISQAFALTQLFQLPLQLLPQHQHQHQGL